MAKKWKTLTGVVYSTNPDFQFNDSSPKQKLTPDKKQQLLYVWIEHKHRGGKSAIIIKGFVGSEMDLEALGKLLKTRCGVGGSVKEGEIIIQGNNREKVIEILTKEGYKTKKSGG